MGAAPAAGRRLRTSPTDPQQIHGALRCLLLMLGTDTAQHGTKPAGDQLSRPADAPEPPLQRRLIVQEGGLEPEGALVKHGIQDAPAMGGGSRVAEARRLGPGSGWKQSRSTNRVRLRLAGDASMGVQHPPVTSAPHQYRFHSSVFESSRCRRNPGMGTFSASTPCKAARRSVGPACGARAQLSSDAERVATLAERGRRQTGKCSTHSGRPHATLRLVCGIRTLPPCPGPPSSPCSACPPGSSPCASPGSQCRARSGRAQRTAGACAAPAARMGVYGCVWGNGTQAPWAAGPHEA